MLPLSSGTFRRPETLSSTGRAALVSSILGVLSGCGTLGSGTIVTARTPVNEAVATTARQQTLMNIVRVYHNEAPVILDLVEADEAVNVTGSAMGNVGGIGAVAGSSGGTLAGRTGMASGTVGAGDAVTNRYVPLQGQALISQLSSQITVETINALYDSDWPIQSLIDLGITRLTPSLEDFDLAEDLLTELDRRRVISLATAKSRFSKAEEKTTINQKTNESITINTQPSSTGGGDTLNIYFNSHSSSYVEKDRIDNDRVWTLLSSLYRNSQPRKNEKSIDRDGRTSVIELRNSPITNLEKIQPDEFKGFYLGPILRTYTSIGILKYITTQPKVAFIDEKSYDAIRALPWNSEYYFKHCPDADTYIIDPSDEGQSQAGDVHIFGRGLASGDQRTSDILAHLKKAADDAQNGKGCLSSYTLSEKDEGKMHQTSVDLGKLKRFILVVESGEPAKDVFTSWKTGGMYYSIMPDDYISQRNLMLVSQFLTIQATSNPTPSLTTISPSGR